MQIAQSLSLGLDEQMQSVADSALGRLDIEKVSHMHIRG